MAQEHAKQAMPTPAAYDPAAVEAKWRQRWAEEQTYKADLDTPQRPYFNLMMFPYPSAEGLHAGHCFTFSGADAHGRFRRMQGNEVFQPMGWDAFGIHSENYALKVNEHPARLTPRTVANFKRQMDRLGAGFDWSHEVNTTDPKYYRWTQWIFVQFFKAGLVEQKEAPVNWCPNDLTVLADEQVIGGRCERCDAVVERRVLKQWFLRITRYAQELLDGLDTIDWSEVVTTAQRNWIGRSEGAYITFGLEGCARRDVTVFTTRPDTLFGATFLVVGADHPQLLDFAAPERREAVAQWQKSLPAQTEEPDFSVAIDLGAHGVHPLTDARIPVYAAPYVLGGYGTGAIMGVPAHDERDHQFARAHGLPIVEVIAGGEVDVQEQSWTTSAGVMVNSGEFNGLGTAEGKKAVVARLAALGRGEAAVQYRLRDWLISRQRYWGPPIPVIHCGTCGPVPVPEDQLPVLLPEVEDFKPIGTGQSPLASVESWVNVECPRCGGPGRRETDVSDTFLDSSWYYLRYPSTDFDDVPFDRTRTWTWLPVSIYIGGKEHSVLHLLYSRFVMRALYDLGHVPAPEPFPVFRAHGMIIKDGAKMSKSRGNVVSPDEYLDRYGADTLRVYLLFLGPYDLGGDFRDEGIAGAVRFLNRVWRATQACTSDAEDEQRERRRHRLIAQVTERMEDLRYNTAIALMMAYADELNGEALAGRGRRVDAQTLVQLLAPLAPHITEELWERTGHRGSVHRSPWPEFDPAMAAAQEVTIPVQVNGKRRAELRVPAGTGVRELERQAMELPRIVEILASGPPPRHVVVVPDRIVNIVV